MQRKCQFIEHIGNCYMKSIYKYATIIIVHISATMLVPNKRNRNREINRKKQL